MLLFPFSSTASGEGAGTPKKCFPMRWHLSMPGSCLERTGSLSSTSSRWGLTSGNSFGSLCHPHSRKCLPWVTWSTVIQSQSCPHLHRNDSDTGQVYKAPRYQLVSRFSAPGKQTPWGGMSIQSQPGCLWKLGQKNTVPEMGTMLSASQPEISIYTGQGKYLE